MEETTKQHEKDIYYLKIAREVAWRSKCLSRKIGSVLVKNDSIIGTGFNGPPHKVPPCSYRDNNGDYTDTIQSDVCPRYRMGFKSGEGLDYCVACHSEINAVLHSAKNGIPTEGSTLYAYCGIPCICCTKEMINAGVKRVVCIKDTEYNQKMKSKNMFLQAGVSLEFVTEEEILATNK